MAKWHTNLKRQEHFDKNNLSHNRVHFSLIILQKTSDFHIFMMARWTLDCRKGPETKIFHPGLVNLPSNNYPILGPMPPLVLFMISMSGSTYLRMRTVTLSDSVFLNFSFDFFVFVIITSILHVNLKYWVNISHPNPVPCKWVMKKTGSAVHMGPLKLGTVSVKSET